MIALCLGVEHLAGLLQLLGGDRRQEVLKEVKVVKEDARDIRMIKERGQDEEERRQGVIKDQLHVLNTQVGKIFYKTDPILQDASLKLINESRAQDFT